PPSPTLMHTTSLHAALPISSLECAHDRRGDPVPPRDRHRPARGPPTTPRPRSLARAGARDRLEPGRPLRLAARPVRVLAGRLRLDRKSTRLNSSHQIISYAV